MSQSDAWYLGQRAENLAVLHLTRRSDLVVLRQVGDDLGLDLMVNIIKDGQYTGRMFGVVLKAAVQAVRRNKKGEYRVQLPARVMVGLRDVPFPICLFFFIMQNDTSYYAWLKEPAPAGGGLLTPYKSHGAISIHEGSSSLTPLTEVALEAIVSRVNNWYDSSATLRTPNTVGQADD